MYEKMYSILYDAVADALREMEKKNYDIAALLLRAAQMKASVKMETEGAGQSGELPAGTLKEQTVSTRYTAGGGHRIPPRRAEHLTWIEDDPASEEPS